ncbi:efflux RND transporter periplasmic adaptor subunit [Nonomuraea basaltis]|uniref:efflux RND transporter periplasmic adaptor subunit n=1 Tax=Nonomuraea basaltis TaxID=2495887 RepID=UPI00110C5871|nr:efflux RND transporter periplasmic adaptor subunit [Nonomuraea basaltis]TMR92979.1 efflux RND transporter periplasmic adaptor subunit [Nonomuraea basaltis]
MRRTFALGALALAVLAGGSGLALALRDDAPAAVQVRLAAAQRGPVTAAVSAAGSTVDGSRRDLAFGSSGTLAKVYVKVGTKVKKGQVLARIDGQAAREAYEAARADLAAAEEALEEASSPTGTTGTGTSGGTACVPGGGTTSTAPAGGTPSGGPTGGTQASGPTGGATATTKATGATTPTGAAAPTTHATSGGTAHGDAVDGGTPGADGIATAGGITTDGGVTVNGGGAFGPSGRPSASASPTPSSTPSPTTTITPRPTATPTSVPTDHPVPEPTVTVTVTATVTTTVTATPSGGASNRGTQPTGDGPSPTGGDPSATSSPTGKPSTSGKPSASGKPTAGGKSSARPSTGATGGARPNQSTGSCNANPAGSKGGTSEDQAAANVDRAEAALEQAADAVRATRIVAPAPGTVLSVAGGVGDAAGTGTFISLGDLNELQVQAMVTESDINRLKLGQKAQITLATRSGERHEGTVTAIAPTATVDGQLVRYSVTLAFDEPPTGLMLGQTASVAVTTDAAKDAIYVPAAAVRSRSDGTQVVTVRSGGRDLAKVVRTGVRGDRYVEVTSGLDESDQVVMSGSTSGEFPDGAWPGA